MTSSHCAGIFIGINYSALKLFLFARETQKELNSKAKQKLMSNFPPECSCEDSNELNKPSNPAFDYPAPGNLGPKLMLFSEIRLPLEGCVSICIHIYMYSIYREKNAVNKC